MNEDSELLRRFADEGAQEAFAELVRRKIDLVYGAALRQTGGDAHLAQDVTQGVFLALACQAEALQQHAVLAGWLYTTTRFLAAKAVRTQARWQRREQEANTMNATATTHGADPAWEQLRPVIDETLHELGEQDRVALLLRYFEGRSLAEVGASIGLAENSARMRVDRALEKLRERLVRRGITSTAAALGAALAAQPAVTAPAGLAASAASVAGAMLAGAALGGAGATAGAGSALAFMSTTKLAAVAAALVTVGALGGFWVAQPSAGASRMTDNQPVSTSAAANAKAMASPPASATALPSSQPATGAPARTNATASSSLDSLRVLVDLQRRKLVTPEMKLFGGKAKISNEFAELFGLTPEQRDGLRNGLVETRARLFELERQNTEVSTAPNGDVTMAVRAFPEAGGALYDALLKTFADTLGADRYQAFLALCSEQLEKELGRFGTALRTVTISRETAAEGEVRYRIRSVARDSAEQSSKYVSDRLTAEQFMGELGPLVELLPAGYLPRK